MSRPGKDESMDDALVRLARAYGVATWYEDWRHRRVEVGQDTVVAVLGALDIDASGPAAVREALKARRARRTGAALPPTLVVRPGRRPPDVPAGELRYPDGTARAIRDGLPEGLPPGRYELTTGDGTSTVLVAPERLADAPRTWGWMLQLYSLRSAGSWGLGDLADLATFAGWAAGTGAGLVLLNPLHAVAPGYPVPTSPYSPSSRRFVNPIYLRVEHTQAYRRADAGLRAKVDALRPDAAPALLDYDATQRAKMGALELLWSTLPARLDDDVEPALLDFATYCALAERHGAGWHGWPEPLRRPDSPATARAREDLAPRVAFHAWLQRECAAQLEDATRAGEGMSVGIVHDLAVGIDPGGADGWMLQDVIAQGFSVGAPPDSFNQLGQDWGLATWRADRLAETGYRAPYELFASALSHGGGLRVDHVAGLWRQWWVPAGATPDKGTYVHYDADAMLAALTLAAARAGAVVIGEDLGTVPPEVTRGMHQRGILGSSVLWFTRDYKDDTEPYLPPRRWPATSVASISTHDLPTAAGFLEAEHVRVRAELGVLGRDAADELTDAKADRALLLDLLRREKLIKDDDPGVPEIIVALHELLARTRSRIVLASPYDVLGEVRQPNLPGTTDQYPNWRIPLPATLDELMADDRVAAVVAALSRRRG